MADSIYGGRQGWRTSSTQNTNIDFRVEGYTDSDLFALDSSGRVGIGTSSPSIILHISHTIETITPLKCIKKHKL